MDESPLDAAERGIGVSVVSVALVTCVLERIQILSGETQDDALDITFKLGLGRPSGNELVVQMTFRFERLHGLRLELTYGVHFRRTAPVEDEDRYWRDVATQVAPVVLYPYVRETVTALTSRAAVPPVILPIVNFKTLIDPASLDIPRAEDAVGEQEGRL